MLQPKYDSPSAAVAELEKFKELFPGVTTTPKESENKVNISSLNI